MKKLFLILSLLPGICFAQSTNPDNKWYACSATVTDTNDAVIKAAVTGARLYISALSCYNNSATSSAITFKDGSTSAWVGFASNSSLIGNYNQAFPTDLRLTVSTAFNFAMTANSTSTVCCAAGYVSRE